MDNSQISTCLELVGQLKGKPSRKFTPFEHKVAMLLRQMGFLYIYCGPEGVSEPTVKCYSDPVGDCDE